MKFAGPFACRSGVLAAIKPCRPTPISQAAVPVRWPLTAAIKKSPARLSPCGAFVWPGEGLNPQSRQRGNYMPMPPIPPMPPMSGMPPPAPASSFGASEIMHSLVNIKEATDAAFCKAVRACHFGGVHFKSCWRSEVCGPLAFRLQGKLLQNPANWQHTVQTSSGRIDS